MNKQEQIEKYIKDLINQRTLKEGDRVFSIREMALMQQTSITPVIAAYQHLEMLGILQSRPKSGFFVSSSAKRPKFSLPPYAKLFNLEEDTQARQFNHISRLVRDQSLRYPFALRQMPAHLTDAPRLNACLKQCAAQFSEKSITTNRRGYSAALTNAIIQHAERTKWLTDPEHITVTTGIVQALLMALEATVRQTEAVAIEIPGNSYFFFAAKLYGVRVVPIPSRTDTGLDLKYLMKAVEKDPSIRCVLCAPNFSTPTGSLMPMPQKHQLLSFCEKKDIAIIEYDIAGDHSFQTLHPLPIKAGGSEQVIYISGFEDPLTDLHYISGGKYHHFIDGFADLHQVYVPVFMQECLALYLTSPQAKKQMYYIRSVLCDAVSAVRKTIIECFPKGTVVSEPKGGRFVWVELPKGYDTLQLLEEAQKQSVSFSPGAVFAPDQDYSNCMRLNCGVAAERPEALEGLRILASLL